MEYNIERFVKAQDYPMRGCGSYAEALEEMKQGMKLRHWIWYVFPQLKWIGNSSMSQFYGIENIEEAKEYLAHPILGARLHEILEAMFNSGCSELLKIMGKRIDASKFCSSMTLFWVASQQMESTPGGDPIFKRAIDTFCRGGYDQLTLRKLEEEA